MWDRVEIKRRGKAVFKANYWRSVLSAFLLSLLVGGSALSAGSNMDDDDVEPVDDMDTSGAEQTFNDAADAFNNLPEDQKSAVGMVIIGAILAGLVVACIAFVLRIFVFNPLQVGCYGFFRENARGLHPDLGVIKSGFGRYGHTFITLLLRDLFLILWTLLFIIPGIVKTYSYRMVPFILRDNPELSATEVITASRHLMNGNKWKTFVFDLSYIGWFLLGCITFGLVNVFWTSPYRQNANAALYLTLIGEKEYREEPVIPLSSEE